MDSTPCYNLENIPHVPMNDFYDLEMESKERYIDMIIDQLHEIAEQNYEYKHADPS